MAGDKILVDEKELTTQLHTLGLVRTIVDRGCRRRDDNHDEFVEILATILNADNASPIELHIEESLAELEGPNFFWFNMFYVI